ncbi:MAG: imidazoleglycerol-phosphate dehydratase HisB [Firmicutes bacterium]|nr:imidazoleglycerol-phosphate dehydratase HisB [Bacillota bacterium]MBQ4093233.1 imidazoleglycerol-phosphate dehydratase HisB [Bacillota bacterium]MBQ6811241.1 imidazoleglycerol-phosphate dehydratase HisB [Bacillota bacterium]
MREASLIRTTKETDIELSLALNGGNDIVIDTGIGFFDHMLTLFARHGNFDLVVKCKGDLNVDAHHSIEDIGIVLGKALKEALGDKYGIRRYGSALIPMDETLAEVALDLSGRSYLVFNAAFTTDRIGEFPTEMAEEFFRAVADNAGMTLHINLRYGKNNHHIAEGIFKAFGHALKDAVALDGSGILSTKGVL